MELDEYPYLLPQADSMTQEWWDALRRHELTVQACGVCGTLRHPPTGTCPNCGSEVVYWQRMSGRGTVYSYITVHQTALPAWKEAVPYNIVMVDLDDAPHIRMYGNVVDADAGDLEIGMPVAAVFDDVTGEDTLLRWRSDSGRD